MKDVKSWIKSKTIWGVIIALSPLFSDKLGFDIGATATDILELIGSAFAIYGRVTAKTEIKKL